MAAIPNDPYREGGKTAVYNRGILSVDNKLVAGVNSISIKLSADNQDLPVIDSPKPYDTLLGDNKYELSFKKYNENSRFIDAIINGIELTCIVYKTDKKTYKRVPFLRFTGVTLSADNIDLDGKNAASEDITASAKDVIILSP